MSRKKLIFISIISLIVISALSALGWHMWLYKSFDTDIPHALTQPNLGFTQLTLEKSKFPPIRHVFVIMEENHDWQSISGNSQAPYINNTLLSQGTHAGNYFNVPPTLGELHPSELNYIFLEAGKVAFSDHTFTSDADPRSDNVTASTDHLTALLDDNGYTWKSYQEGISGNDCPIHSQSSYAPKHNPMLYFTDVSGNPPESTNDYCIQHIRPISELTADLQSGKVPNYVFITPNLNHDMHNGSIAQADTWLSQVVPTITGSKTFQKDGALFITWDEGTELKLGDNEKNNPIGMIVLSPFAKKGYTNNIQYSHASTLKTIEEIFHLQPLLGLANDPQTNDLSDLFQR